MLRWLGCGGFGDVWQARHVELNQQRAIKVLRLDRFGPEEQDLLRREARLMAQAPAALQPRPCHRYRGARRAVGAGDGLCRRRRLGELAPLRWKEAVRYLHDIAVGLADLHGRDIQHRDIKPGNFLWDAVHDRAVLSDYGLADRMGRPGVGRTPGYAGPEAVAGSPNFASDIFALAASLYFLLAPPPAFPRHDGGRDGAEDASRVAPAGS